MNEYSINYLNIRNHIAVHVDCFKESLLRYMQSNESNDNFETYLNKEANNLVSAMENMMKDVVATETERSNVALQKANCVITMQKLLYGETLSHPLDNQ